MAGPYSFKFLGCTAASASCGCGLSGLPGVENGTAISYIRQADIVTSYTTCSAPPTGCRNYAAASDVTVLSAASTGGSYMLVFCSGGYGQHIGQYYASRCNTCASYVQMTPTAGSPQNFNFPLDSGEAASGGAREVSLSEATACFILPFYVGDVNTTDGAAVWKFAWTQPVGSSDGYPINNPDGGASENPLWRLWKLAAPDVEIACLNNTVTTGPAAGELTLGVEARVYRQDDRYKHDYTARLITYLDTGAGHVEQRRELVDIGSFGGDYLTITVLDDWSWTAAPANWTEGEIKVRLEELDGTLITEELFDWTTTWVGGWTPSADCSTFGVEWRLSRQAPVGAYRPGRVQSFLRAEGLGMAGKPSNDATRPVDFSAVFAWVASGTHINLSLAYFDTAMGAYWDCIEETDGTHTNCYQWSFASSLHCDYAYASDQNWQLKITVTDKGTAHVITSDAWTTDDWNDAIDLEGTPGSP